MRLTFINVGYGEAILIEYPDKSQQTGKFTVLIDGGSNEDAEFEGFPFRTRVFDYLLKAGIKCINLMVSTHIHEDHICGLLQVVRKMNVENLWCNYRIPECFIKSKIDSSIAECESQRKFINALNDYNELTDILLNRGVVPCEVRGICEEVEICKGLYTDILSPKLYDAEELKERMESLYRAESHIQQKKVIAELDSWMNNTSVMMRLHVGGKKILFSGDVNRAGYEHITKKAQLLEADIFKIGHHGQMDGVSAALIDKISPKIIVTCASSDRRYESANPEIFELIQNSVRTYSPVFLFSDNVNLPPYSQGIKDHSALVIYVDESNGEITWTYE